MYLSITHSTHTHTCTCHIHTCTCTHYTTPHTKHTLNIHTHHTPHSHALQPDHAIQSQLFTRISESFTLLINNMSSHHKDAVFWVNTLPPSIHWCTSVLITGYNFISCYDAFHLFSFAALCQVSGTSTIRSFLSGFPRLCCHIGF